MNSVIENTLTGREIAVIGMACRAPGVPTTDDLWQLSKSGKEGLSTFTRQELEEAGVVRTLLDDPNYVMKTGYLADKNLFDAALFGYNPGQAKIMDPQFAKFHECVWEAMEQAGYYTGRIGVYAGVGDSSSWYNRIVNENDSAADSFSADSMTGPNFLSTRISYNFNLTGPSQNVQTACSTSLVAVHEACQSLLTYQCDIALAGGGTITPDDKQGYLYQEGMIMSPDGCCRPFDISAAGTVAGEGVGVVVLKRLEDAINDNDNILAVIKGSATNNDGNRKQAFTAPSVMGQSEVISDALDMAEVNPASIGYIETHGTGTNLGDPIEIVALNKAYGLETTKSKRIGYCVIGALKSQIGHTDTGAGVLGLIRAIQIIQYKQFPPSAYFKLPNPELNLANTPFRVNTELSDWHCPEGSRRAGISSFGIGGTNAHVILEEACFERQTSESRNTQMVFLSANTKTALAKINDEQLQYLEQHPETSLPDLCYTRQVGRKPLRYRKAMAVSSIEELKQVLANTQDLTDNTQDLTDNIQIHTGLAVDDNKIAFLFPGQGAQYANMGKSLYETEPVFRQWLDKCFNIAEEKSGIDFNASLFPTDKSDTSINQTENTQPLLFMLEYSLAQQLMHWGIKPDIMIGHSVGEYVAACLAGVFTLEDAITLIIKRGALIQVLPQGDMLSVRTDKATIEPFLAGLNQTKERVDIAAINSPKLLVVSGDQDAIATLQIALDEKDIPHSLLHTSHAFHSHHLDSALAEFKTAVEAVTLSPPEPELPYISNVTGERINPEQATSSDYWVQHMRGCVQFSGGVETLAEQESLALLEVGPGQVLSTFVQQNPAKTSTHHCVNLMPSAQDIARVGSEDKTSTMDQKALFSGLCKLFTLGTLLNWQAFYEEEKRGIVGDLPTYPFEGKAYWIPRPSNALGISSTSTDLLAPQPIENWYSIPTWQPSSLPPTLQIKEEQKWLIFVDEHGVGNQVNQRLLGIDRQAVSVLMGQKYEQKDAHTFVINPTEPQHYKHLFAELEQQTLLPSTIIHLWGIDNLKQSENTAAIKRRIVLGFYSQLYLCQAFDQISTPLDVSLKIVTNATQCLHPGENCYPEKALSLAPSRVIPAEYPFVTCQFIDCLLPDLLGGSVNSTRLINELLSAQVKDKFIACRGGLRWQQIYNSIALPPVEQLPTLLRQQGCYLITGGLGGIGLVIANYLSQQGQYTIILLSRSGFIDKEQWEKWLSDHNINDAISKKIQVLKDIDAAGSTVKIVTADVADAATLKEALTPWMKKTNRINGVFHTAGLASQGAIQLKQEKDLEYALAAKVAGTCNLHTFFAKDTLDFMILSSSQTAIIGGEGEIDYCAANLFLDAFAQQHDNLEGTRYIAINWPAWKETGMAVNAILSSNQEIEKEHYLQTFGITSAQGMEALGRLISHPMFSQVVVGPFPIATLADAVAAFERNLVERAMEHTVADDTSDSLIEYVVPQTKTQEKLAQIWAIKLGVRQVSVTANLFQLGADSLQFISVSSELKSQFNAKLEFEKLLQLTTIQQQAEALDQLSNDKTDVIPALIQLHKNSALASYSQQRLWFITQLVQQQVAYNIFFALHLKGALKHEVLCKVLETVIRRHTSLCTTFSSDENGNCIQTIQTNFTFELPILDLSALSKTEQNKQVTESINQEQKTEFDLSKDLLLRAKLIKQSEQHHILLLSMHHIASDGASVGILIDELNALYNTEIQAQSIALPTLPVQYIDYSQWQREWFQGNLKQDLDFWKGYLKDIPQVHNLPLDNPRPSQQSYKGDYHLQKIDQTITEKLQQLAQQVDTTLFVVMQAALSTFISRYSNETDIVVGFPIANRGHKEIESLIGFFINTLILRSDLSNDPVFIDLLVETKKNIFSAYSHQHIPFELLVEELNPQRNLSHSPLFQITLAYQHQQGEGINFSDLQATPIDIKGKYSKFDLNLEMTETPEGLEILWEYASDIFEVDSITRWAANLAVLLKGIVSNPQQNVSKLPLLSQHEQQVILDRNHPHVSFPQKKCISTIFEEHVKSHPNAIALIFKDLSLTYSELNQSANQVAHYLLEQGVKPDTLVGICIERSLDMIIGLLGILKAGGAYMPLDPAYPKSRLNYLLEDSRLTLLLTTRDLHNQHDFIDQKVILLGSDSFLNSYSTKNINTDILNLRPDHLAYVNYTSGSTGNPKGVCVTHQGVTRLVCQTNYIELNRDTTTLQQSTVCFDAATFEIWAPLLNGGKLVVYDGESADVAAIGKTVKKYSINTLFLTSGLLPIWTEAHKCSNLDLKFLLTGGDVVPPTNVQDLYSHDSHIIILNCYGPTENTTFSTVYPVPRTMDEETALPIGKPIAQSTCYVLNQQQQLAPIGCIGELYVGGMGLARGYLNREVFTAEKFINVPFMNNSNERLYRTGDLVRWLPNGNIEFIGRVDFQVKIRGFRVELGEIEAQLAISELVKECIVLAREDTPGDKHLVAYFVSKDKIQNTEDRDILSELRNQLKSCLPDYMVPAAFVRLDALPLTRNGKVDRKALPVPTADSLIQEIYEAPNTETEKILCQIWQEILNVEPIGIHDNFFALGGHSLIAIKLVSRIREQFSIPLPINEIFKTSTVSDLALSIETLKPEQLLPLQKVEQGKAVPLSYMQQLMWSSMQKPELKNTFHSPFSLIFYGQMDLLVLKKSLQTIIDRHDILKTYLAEQGDQTNMLINDTFIFDLTISTADSIDDINTLFKAKREEGFDFYNGPLIKSYLWKITEDKSVLIVDIHHLLSDGWSVEVFKNELNHFYTCYSQGVTPNLPPLPIQYQDFAFCQYQWHQTDKYQKELKYWNKILEKYSGYCIPTDTPRHLINDYRLTDKEIVISELLYDEILKFCKHKEITPYVFFMTAFHLSLYHYSGIKNIMVTSPMAERGRSELENTIGLHLNLQLIQCQISDESTLEEILQQVEEQRSRAAQSDINFNIGAIYEENKENTKVQALFGALQFNFLDFPNEEKWTLPNLKVEPFILDFTDIPIAIELSLTIKKIPQGGKINLTYINALFRPKAITQIAEGFKQALQAIITESNKTVAQAVLREDKPKPLFETTET